MGNDKMGCKITFIGVVSINLCGRVNKMCKL